MFLEFSILSADPDQLMQSVSFTVIFLTHFVTSHFNSAVIDKPYTIVSFMSIIHTFCNVDSLGILITITLSNFSRLNSKRVKQIFLLRFTFESKAVSSQTEIVEDQNTVVAH